MATYVFAKVSTQYIFFASLVSQANTKIMQVNPTIAAGDFKVSIDGAALANLGTLPAVTPAGSSMVKFTLSTSEMAGANATVVCSDAAGAEWCDLTINIPTAARQIDDLAYPATSGRSMVVDAAGLVDSNVVKLGPTGAGSAQTARDIGSSVLLSTGSGTGQLDFTSGVVKANPTQWLGGTIPAVNVTGVPLVDLKYTLGTISPAAAGSVRADAVTGAVGSVTGAVGSVTGAVGSVTGAVGSVTGAVGSVTGAVGSVTGNVGGNVVGSVATVTDITTTAQAELTAPPASNASPLAKLNWLFILAKNKLTQTSTTQIVKANDGSTTVGTSTVSDDGTTATRGVFS